MEKRLKIYTFADKNPEFIQLQIDSFKLHMDDGNTDFIIINASTSNFSEIESICEKNNIQSMKYTGIVTPFPHYVVEQYAWFRELIQSNTKDYILIIHSDMFFINKLDYKKLLSKYNIIINPQYRDTPFYKITHGNFNYYYMWDGILLFDSQYFNEKNLTKLFDWGMVQGVLDVGGQTTKLLKSLSKEEVGFFEFWTYHELKDNVLTTGLNGGVGFTINVTDKKIETPFQMGNKSFPYETDKSDYESYIIEKSLEIKKIFIDPYDFISPVHSDWIQVLDEPIEQAFIFHFKSGSMDTNKNNFHKLEQIKKIVYNK
jgi:hypothetical protein